MNRTILLPSLSYLLTQWSRVLLENLTGFQLVKKIPKFYGTRRFITSFTSARHLYLSWASSIQSIPPHPTSWRSILILSSHLRLDLPNGLFPSGFPIKTLNKPLPFLIRATWPVHLILLDFITRTTFGEQYRSLRSPICLNTYITYSALYILYTEITWELCTRIMIIYSKWCVIFHSFILIH